MRKQRDSLRLALLMTLTLSGGVADASDRSTLSDPVDNARIEVEKSERRLLLFSGDELIRTYTVGLGFEPVKNKVREGDGATPEGEYIVVVKNPQSQFYLSLGINYPNAHDADRGLESGLISEAEHRDIHRAEERGVRPPWNTALGGEIFIHGRGAGSDWTLGCVALDDPDMKELYGAISIGTRVRIRP
ncbi:MAG: L,D-transpeptidase family protein [Acidobacteriota bacterium]